MANNDLASVLQRVVDAKGNIGDAIEAKGVPVSATDGLEDFPDLISQISGGGGDLVKTKIVNSINTASPSSSAPKGTTLNLWTIDSANEMLVLNKVAVETSIRGTGVYVPDTWNTKTWTGLTSFKGENIWSDGKNIYYSNGSDQYVLDKSTSTWSSKTWSDLTSFSGNYIWTDGENVYYSASTTQYVLNKNNSTWTAKTWTGLSSFSGSNIWTDGENVYYSSPSSQYVVNKSTSTWSTKSWTGLTNFSGNHIWTDGSDIYYSGGSSSTQYVLE